MNRSILRRLETLERQAPEDMRKSHVILVCSDEEEERQTQALKASPQWTEGDTLMVIRLVGPDPDQADARLSTAAPELG